MGFETLVLAKVAKVLGSDKQAMFEYGTLFVSGLTKDEAEKVRDMLSMNWMLRVEMNDMGSTVDEFAYDFS